jgi:hypothetical protein
MNTLPATNLGPQRRGWLLSVIIATEILFLCIPGMWWVYAGLSVLAVFVLFRMILSVLQERATSVLLAWVLVFPLGYYYATFPRNEALFTLDRLLIFALMVAACLSYQEDTFAIPRDLRHTAMCWFVFVMFAALTIPRVKLPLSASRVLLEAFVFPAILGWFVLRYFDVTKNMRVLHIFTCVMVTYSAGVGLAEIVLQRDLLALPSSGVYLAGNDPTTGFLVRPNGPFTTISSFAQVGLVSLFFIGFLKKALAEKMPPWQRVLHRIGVTAAFAAAVMPLFRSVLMAIVVILLVDAYYQRGVRRWVRVGALFGLLSIGLALYSALPVIFEERAGSGNLYGRIAELKQVILVVMDYPMTGVGFTNFVDAAQHSRYVTSYQGVLSVDAQHNNLSAIISETGLTGFVPYVISQILFVACFWRLRQTRSGSSELVWKSFLFIFLAYWINGMSLSSGYSADLNLWYMFVLMVIYKFAQTVSDRPQFSS